MTYAEYVEKVSQVIQENNNRVAAKFKECETYVNTVLCKQYPDCEIVWTKHEEDIRAGRFFVWLGNGRGHRFYYFEDCNLGKLELLPLPERRC